MRQLEGKTAFITGGASGIGFGIARAFLLHGMKVVMADVMQAHLDEASEALKGANGEYHFVRVDVRDRDWMARAADETEKVFGKVHVLCNNAGVATTVGMTEATYADWDGVMGINFGGVVNGINTFLPRMRAHGEGGHIVNTSSMAGILPMPGPGGLYSTSKFAVRGLTESLRLALGSEKIGVSMLCPGLVKTNLADTTQALNPANKAVEDLAFLDQETPLAGGMDPLDVGDSVVQGIRENRAYIFPHGEFRDEVREMFDAILSAFPGDQDIHPKRLEFEAMRRQATMEARKMAASL
jgi:NAD(P)-dependent dehydrogenase (short-subunit alcohol dehydrogenase family)